jgi:hypothetical protein
MTPQVMMTLVLWQSKAELRAGFRKRGARLEQTNSNFREQTNFADKLSRTMVKLV